MALLTPIVLAAATLGQISAADVRKVFVLDDYPTVMFQNEQSVAAVIEFWVDPKKLVSRCQVVSIVGSQTAAKRICPIVEKKKLPPAYFSDGTPANGFVRTLLRMFVPGTQQGDVVSATNQSADLELTVNSLPGGLTRQQGTITLSVAPDGAVQDCLPHGAPHTTVPSLPAQICDFREFLRQQPHTDATGQPIAYITTVLVDLVVKPGAAK